MTADLFGYPTWQALLVIVLLGVLILAIGKRL